MSSALTQPPAMTEGTSPSRPGLPAMSRLAWAAVGVSAPAAAVLLLMGRLRPALGILAGLVIGLVVYGLLHVLVGRVLGPFLSSVRGQAKPAAGGGTFTFVALLPLKFLLLGGLMFLLLRVGHVSLLWFAVGFLLTQVSVTIAAVGHLARARAR